MIGIRSSAKRSGQLLRQETSSQADCPSVSHGIKRNTSPPQSPKTNSYADRFVRSVKTECLNKLIFFGEDSLRKTLVEYTDHYHEEINHPSVSY